MQSCSQNRSKFMKCMPQTTTLPCYIGPQFADGDNTQRFVISRISNRVTGMRVHSSE